MLWLPSHWMLLSERLEFRLQPLVLCPAPSGLGSLAFTFQLPEKYSDGDIIMTL